MDWKFSKESKEIVDLGVPEEPIPAVPVEPNGEIVVDPREIVFAHIGSGAFWNARRTFCTMSMEELQADIQDKGLTHPITVREFRGKNQVICGERRLRCILNLLQTKAMCYSRIANTRIPAEELYGSIRIPIVYNCSDEQAIALSYSENAQRSNISDYDLMHYCYRLCNMDHTGEITSEKSQFVYTQKQVAGFLRKSDCWVSQTISLLALPERAKKMLQENTLTRSSAIYLLKVDQHVIDQFLNLIEITVKQEQEHESGRLEVEIGELREQMELNNVSEVLAKPADKLKIGKAKQMLADKLAEAKERKKKVSAPRLTPERLQQLADGIPNARTRKSIAISHRTIRKMRDDLLACDKYDARSKSLALGVLDMCLGITDERHVFHVLDKLFS